jgi:hypothetical protein
MADTKFARQAVQKASKALLESKGRQIAENGRDQLIGEIDATDGFWSDRSKWAKPGRWLLILERKDANTVVASLPINNNAKRIAGSINAARGIHMGVSTRVVAAIKDGEKYALHGDFEWLLLFVFPDLPTIPAGKTTSGDTASFDPTTGQLVMKEIYPQPYVAAQLFKVADNPLPYENGANIITYQQATDAIVEFITISPLKPEDDGAAIAGGGA